MRVNKKSLLAAGAAAVVVTLGLRPAPGSGDNEPAEAVGGTLTVWVDAERVDALARRGLLGRPVSRSTRRQGQRRHQGRLHPAGPDRQGPRHHDGCARLAGRALDERRRRADRARRLRRRLPARRDRRVDLRGHHLHASLRGREHRRAAQRRPRPRGRHELRRHDRQGPGRRPHTPFVVEQGAEGNPYHLYPFQTAFGAPVFGTNDEGYDPTDLQLGNAGGEEFATWLGAQGKNGTASSTPTSTVTSPSRRSSTAPPPSG